MCIIYVLDPQHLFAKNTNSWNNKFYANFEQPNETNKFMISKNDLFCSLHQSNNFHKNN
jgi:hypothetical protein